MKYFFLLSLLLIHLSLSTYAQVDSISNRLIPYSIDSIQFSIWDMHTKEMSISNQENEYEKEIGQTVLSDHDKEILISNLLNPKSYDQTRAQLYHYNLLFDLYHNGVISTRIYISTMTGNVDIENKLEEIYFINNCSEIFGEVLLDLLNRYDFTKSFDEIDIEGITTYNKNIQH